MPAAPTDFFLSYRSARAAEVQPLLDALTALRCTVWRDGERIDSGDSITDKVREGLSKSRALIVWASEDYYDSRICQTELRAAWISAEQAGKPQERIFLFLPPGVDPKKLPPLRPEADILLFSAPSDTEGWQKLAMQLRDHLPRDTRSFGDLRPILAPAPWWPERRHPSPRFVGRQKELWQLHGLLLQDRLVAVTGHQKAAPAQLQGLGGVGKSTLAIEYATLFEAAWPGGIFYLNLADGREREQREAELALCLGLSGSTDAERAAALRRKLQYTPEPYLWLLDGVPAEFSQEEVQRHCAPGGGGRSLLTTRSRAWKGLGRSLDLEVLPPEDALALLLARRGGVPVESEWAALALCAKVGHLPLALDLLAALQAESPLPESEWCRRLDQPDDDALEWATDLEEQLPTGCSRSVAEVLSQSLKALKKEESWKLLLYLAVLADAPVPEDFLYQAMEGERPCRSAVAELRAHSLVPSTGLGIHALVRRVLQRQTDRAGHREEGRQRLVQLLTGQLNSVDANDVRTHDPVRALLVHVETLAGEEAGAEEAGLWFDAAHLWLSQGSYPTAQKGWEQALAAMTRILGPEHPDMLTTLQNLAVTLKAQGDLAGARLRQEQVLAARMRFLGPEHPDTLTTLQNLAGTLKAQGDLPGARNRFEQVLDARTHILGPEHPDTVGTLQNLALTLDAQGDLAGARNRFEQALDAMTRILGPEHPHTLGTLQNLAGTLYAQGDIAGARLRAEQVLAARMRFLGPEHPDTLATLQNLARTLKAQGDLAGARLREEQGLAAMTRILGPEHPDTLNTLQNLAVTLKAQGDLAGARLREEQALDAMTRILGPEHPDTLATLQNLAGTMYVLGDPAGARLRFEQALDARTRILGPEHPGTNVTRFNLVLTLLNLDPPAAVPHLQQLTHLFQRPPETLAATDKQIMSALVQMFGESEGDT